MELGLHPLWSRSLHLRSRKRQILRRTRRVRRKRKMGRKKRRGCGLPWVVFLRWEAGRRGASETEGGPRKHRQPQGHRHRRKRRLRQRSGSPWVLGVRLGAVLSALRRLRRPRGRRQQRPRKRSGPRRPLVRTRQQRLPQPPRQLRLLLQRRLRLIVWLSLSKRQRNRHLRFWVSLRAFRQQRLKRKRWLPRLRVLRRRPPRRRRSRRPLIPRTR
mmetsp:Transcript_62920/g.159268  ORF Transcript_62920/g.159268 Transcript_62920/m.159268 type:complete len:215 (-) Transcript_62920:457-1101(-)